VNDRLRIDLRLNVGEATESVSVSGAAPLVETESGALGSVIENRKVRDLPLNTRNAFQLASLSAGVIPSPAFGDLFNSSANLMINGARGNTSEMLIDGITNSVPAANPILVASMFPSPDAVQEFKVQTNSYAAEYGRSAGGIVNMVIKSGTNQLEGVAYEFLRNSALDANDFFANRAGTELGSFKRNQFGGALGGPIISDRAFFFVNYEGLRQRPQTTLTATVPTEAERRGDFSQSRKRLSDGTCAPVEIFDPFSTRPNPAGGGFIRDPFPNNVVPLDRQDPVGQRIVDFFPAPNVAGDACTGANNFFSSKTSALDTDQIDVKLDWVPGSKDKVSLGLASRRFENTPPNFYENIADTRVFTGDSIPSRSLRLQYDRIQSPTLLMTARVGVTRLDREWSTNAPAGFSLTELGFPASLDSQLVAPLDFPNFSFTNYASLGRGGGFLDQVGTSYTTAFSLTNVRGRHTLKSGVDFRINQSSEVVGADTSGAFSFSRAFTQGPDPNLPGPDRGDAVAGLLLGVPSSGGANIVPGVYTTSRYLGLYIQDDFKVTSKLTLNLGLRYDLETPRTERDDQLSFFDFNTPSPIAEEVGIPDLHGGLRFVGVDGNPSSQFDTDRNNVAPRLGFAYALSPTMVLRGGYGIFYTQCVCTASGWASGISGFIQATEMATSRDGVRPNDLLSNPFPSGTAQPTAPDSGLLTSLGQSLGATGRDGAIDRGNRVGYSQQWNVGLQRELGGNIVVELAYAGSRGVKLADGPLGHQINQLSSEQLALGTDLQELVPNPFQPYVETGPLSQLEISRAQLLRPFPQFLNVFNFRPASASSIYHAVQARVEKRFSHGLTFLAAYTAGKLIDDSSQAVGFLGPAPTHQDVFNRDASRSLSAQDVSQRLVGSVVYELPVGRDKALGSTMHPLVDAILGNWQINGILTLATGVPLAIVNAENNSESFSAVQRPNIDGHASLAGNRSTGEQLAQWFDTSVFSQPAPFTFGNAPRVLPNVRADGISNLDFSLFKRFRIMDDRRVELRAEVFNLFNHSQFAAPGQVFGNPTFGVVNSLANNPRQIQLALKVYF
ncbi:MAG: TonB-dependent receptor domain-containing protein, partial [Vicinamibacteraceae bacterium]